MKIDVLTLFPEMFQGVFEQSIISRAQKKGLIKINLHNLRDWATDKHKTATSAKAELRRCGRVDDTPYGGGAGMVLKVDVIDRALHNLKLKAKNSKLKTILLTPKGETYTQQKARTLSQVSNLILICGHYQGFDERIRKLVDQEISIGNYILTGGEIPVMVLVDSISRLVPGVINPKSLKHESFSPDNLSCFRALVHESKNRKFSNYKKKEEIKQSYLECPQYTKPEIYKPISIKTKKPLQVPKILLSGNHQEIKKWRENKRKIVKKNRPMCPVC